MNVIPFNRPVIVRETSVEEQRKYAEANTSKDDSLVIPASQHELIITDKPLPKIEEAIQTQKPNEIQIESPTPVAPAPVSNRISWNTVLISAGIVILGYIVYKKYGK